MQPLGTRRSCGSGSPISVQELPTPHIWLSSAFFNRGQDADRRERTESINKAVVSEVPAQAPEGPERQ